MMRLLETMDIVHNIEFTVAKVIYKGILETCPIVSKITTN